MSVYDEIVDIVTDFLGNPSADVGTFNYLGIDITITLDLTILRSAEASDKISPPFFASNIAIVMANLFENPESTIFQSLIAASPIEDLNIVFAIRPTDVASIGESQFMGDTTLGYARINIGWLDMEYLSGSTYERFNLQHIVNHEMVHVFTGLEDGQEHIDLTNQVNAQTDGGPPAVGYGYFREVDSTDSIFYHCFPSGTLIDIWPADAMPCSDGTYDQTAILAGLWQKPIEDITPADIVVAHDANGNLVPGRVTQLLHNITDTWLQLSNGTVVTPGHRFLRPDSSFAEIQDIIADDGRIVAADGAIQTVTAEVIRYSAETAHMFEEAEMLVYGTSGGLVGCASSTPR